MDIIARNEILSFEDMPRLAEKCEKTVLLLRHSMRQSLVNGTDPGLTPEGTDYAIRCGALLAGLTDTAFGASSRKRTIETARALQQGGNFPASEIGIYAEIRDTALFTRPENLDIAVQNGTVPDIARSYFYSGKAPGTIDLKIFSDQLLAFLTQTNFKSRNTILLSHDIVCVSLMLPRGVYPFKLESDWCGYIQGGALLFTGREWRLHYIVPDASKRERAALFV